MAELPQPWREYMRLQSQLDKNTRIDDRNWGLEAGLKKLSARRLLVLPKAKSLARFQAKRAASVTEPTFVEYILAHRI